MNLLPITAGLGTAALLGGLILLVRELVGRRSDTPARPPSRLGASLADPSVRRSLLIALVVGIAVWMTTRWPVAALAAAAAAVTLPKVITGRAAAACIQKLEALEQWTRRLCDLLTAGRALEHALAQSAARNVPPAIAAPVSNLARRVSVHRLPTEQALRQFADELNDPVGDRISAALILVSRRRGKKAGVVLAHLAELVAKDVSDRREVEAARAEHRTTVRWIVIILAIFASLAVWQRDYVAPYGTPIGQAVLAVVVAFYAGALWWLYRLGNAAPGYRFLSKEGSQ